jgi:serine/threonine protein kinase
MSKHLAQTITPEIANYFGIANMENIELFHQCATLALQYFLENPDKQKITRDEWPRLFPDAPVTTCSFLNNKSEHAEQGIYALSRIELGSGAYGKVKFGLRIDQPDMRLFTVKIQTPTNLKELNSILEEERLGLNRQFFTEKKLIRSGAGKDKKDKYYLISPYAGITLKKWLEKPHSSQEELYVAINLSLQLHEMHSGSPDCPRIVHRDLKLDNVFILNNKITIGDYGQSSDAVCMPALELTGSRWYLPYYPKQFEIAARQILDTNTKRMELEGATAQILATYVKKQKLELDKILATNMRSLGRLGVDYFAWCRMLYMPFKVDKFITPPPPSILGEEIRARLPKQIFDLIDTTNIEAIIEATIERKTTPQLIATHLILFRYGCSNEATPVRLNESLQRKIIDIYRSQDLSEQQKREYLMLMQQGSLSPASSTESLSTPIANNPAGFYYSPPARDAVCSAVCLQN